ncbi:hypothetical protein KSP39_PZI014163 [Platanthera zijinensis]|uniref:Uncharacterized protein n=1 Tax=Platanthera zijinensis TaxID=2320716 RepID=A0AAP0BCU2_9ASPA
MSDVAGASSSLTKVASCTNKSTEDCLEDIDTTTRGRSRSRYRRWGKICPDEQGRNQKRHPPSGDNCIDVAGETPSQKLQVYFSGIAGASKVASHAYLQELVWRNHPVAIFLLETHK